MIKLRTYGRGEATSFDTVIPTQLLSWSTFNGYRWDDLYQGRDSQSQPMRHEINLISDWATGSSLSPSLFPNIIHHPFQVISESSKERRSWLLSLLVATILGVGSTSAQSRVTSGDQPGDPEAGTRGRQDNEWSRSLSPSLPEPPGPRLRSRGEGTNRKPFVVNLDTFCQKTKTFDEKML